jgi:hypothetical protein
LPRRSAKLVKALFDALVAEGFTPDQALVLVTNLLGSLGGSLKK